MISWTDLAPYVDPNGLIADRPNPTQSTGNALLRTGQAIKLLYQAAGNKLTPEIYGLASAMMKCASPAPRVTAGWETPKTIPYFFYRTPVACPFWNDQESQDDYIGVGVMSALVSPGVARSVLEYGQSHYFRWKFLKFRYYWRTDAQFPDDGTLINAWLGRFPCFVPHLQRAAGDKPNWFRRLCWAAGIALCANTQDGWALTDLMVFVAQQRGTGWLERLAIWNRARRLAKLHPEGMSGILQAYFGGFAHPIAVHYDDTGEDT